jgi:hypothetical protein
MNKGYTRTVVEPATQTAFTPNVTVSKMAMNEVARQSRAEQSNARAAAAAAAAGEASKRAVAARVLFIMAMKTARRRPMAAASKCRVRALTHLDVALSEPPLVWSSTATV